eukprot:COSAG01_NODE_7454_length_3204_cov_15.414681_2_plen_484_part_00
MGACSHLVSVEDLTEDLDGLQCTAVRTCLKNVRVRLGYCTVLVTFSPPKLYQASGHQSPSRGSFYLVPERPPPFPRSSLVTERSTTPPPHRDTSWVGPQEELKFYTRSMEQRHAGHRLDNAACAMVSMTQVAKAADATDAAPPEAHATASEAPTLRRLQAKGGADEHEEVQEHVRGGGANQCGDRPMFEGHLILCPTCQDSPNWPPWCGNEYGHLPLLVPPPSGLNPTHHQKSTSLGARPHKKKKPTDVAAAGPQKKKPREEVLRKGVGDAKPAEQLGVAAAQPGSQLRLAQLAQSRARIRTKSKPQPSQTPSQSLRRNVLRVIVHNDGTAGEPQFACSGAADCPTAAPYRFRILPKCLVKRYRYTSEYRTTVRETLLISYCKYAAMQPAPSSQQPAASQPASYQQWRGTQAVPATAHSLAGTAAHRGCLPARQGATRANPVGWDQASRLKDLDTSEGWRRSFPRNDNIRISSKFYLPHFIPV